MKYLIATSDKTYFLWQILVQINNFKRIGIEEEVVYLISYDKKISDKAKLLSKKVGDNQFKFFFFKDNRKKKKYVSSVRPFIISDYLREHPTKEALFYIDPDILFKEKVGFTKTMLENDICYLSDTKSYISSEYIKGKDERLFRIMCAIAGIPYTVVENNDNVAGGAQYLLKNTTEEFWNKVEKDSEALFIHMVNTSKYFSPEHPIQSWTADMWALLWNLWNDGIETKTIKRLDFAWATEPITSLNNKSIFHNAGVVKQKNLFNKGNYYIKSPFNDDLSFVDEKMCSSFYVKEIEDTKKNYPDLTSKI